MSKFFFQMSTFFSVEQTRRALIFRYVNQLSTFFSVEHYSVDEQGVDEQGEMSTFLSDEQVKLSTLYFQMSAFSL